MPTLARACPPSSERIGKPFPLTRRVTPQAMAANASAKYNGQRLNQRGGHLTDRIVTNTPRCADGFANRSLSPAVGWDGSRRHVPGYNRRAAEGEQQGARDEGLGGSCTAMSRCIAESRGRWSRRTSPVPWNFNPGFTELHDNVPSASNRQRPTLRAAGCQSNRCYRTEARTVSRQLLISEDKSTIFEVSGTNKVERKAWHDEIVYSTSHVHRR